MTFEMYCDVSSPLLWNYLTLNWWTSWLRYRQALPAINESWIKKKNKQTNKQEHARLERVEDL